MNENLQKLRELFDSHDVDGFVVPSTDEFQNEYVPSYLNRLQYLTGFTGSNGVAIITREKAVFYTDGRYLLQASQELSDEFEVLDMYVKKSCDWFDAKLEKGDRLGYDPMLHTEQNLDYYKKIAKRVGFEMKPVDNLVDQMWELRPKPTQNLIAKHDIEYAGQESSEKIQEVIQAMKVEADNLLITSPDSICWLLNIRGEDVDYNPILLAYAVLRRDGHIDLFADPAKVKDKLPGVYVYPLEEIREKFGEYKNVQVDPERAPVLFVNKDSIKATDPCVMLKACKNSIELQGAREAHLQDGVAVTKFLYWMEQNVARGIDEIEAAKQLLKFRKERDLFKYPSFATISGFGSNGAIIHYSPSDKTKKTITKDGLYLLDSGGQYLNGTTDVTRTMCYGKPSAEQKRNFTLVLKGHIALTRAKFLEGSIGIQLDILARQYLWQEGVDYAHGTGHGVGSYLSVHEDPQRIGKGNACHTELKENMILSNEPGYYKEGEYGIRIENLIVVRKAKEKGFLEFENLTLVPIDMKLVDRSLLTQEEITWLNDYHEEVLAMLSPHLTEDETKWLEAKVS